MPRKTSSSSKNKQTLNSKSVKKQKTARSQQGLRKKTKEFSKFMKSKKNKKISFNSLPQILSIPKRRVYDIMNPLYAVGFVQKLKNKQIQWTAGNYLKEKQIEECCQQDLQTMQRLEKQLQKRRDMLNEKIKNECLKKSMDEEKKMVLIQKQNAETFAPIIGETRLKEICKQMEKQKAAMNFGAKNKQIFIKSLKN